MSSNEFIYGYHTVKALLAAQPQQVRCLYLAIERQDKRSQSLNDLARSVNVAVKRFTRDELDRLLATQAPHQGVVAACYGYSGLAEKALAILLDDLAAQPKLLLLLDGVQDPHNLGACIRSANALGVDAVIAPKDRAAGITPSVRKVACGAVATMPFFQVTNLVRTMRELQQRGIWIVGADAQAQTALSAIDYRGDVAVVMGSEGSGMRQLTRRQCDYVAYIPMCGDVASLNVSVATAIFLYEVQRQRTV